MTLTGPALPPTSAPEPPRPFLRELVEADLGPLPDPGPPVTEADLAPLPDTVRRWLRASGVIGRPRDASFRVASRGRFRLRPEAAWLPCDAWQHNTGTDLARIFRMRLRVGGVLPVVGHDSYAHGKGRMLVKALDLFPVADAGGEELAIGELVTWLNDAVLLAPSMLLGEAVRFAAVDDGSFDVSVTDAGRTVTGRVFLDERARVVDFVTTDRFVQDPYAARRPWVRCRWSTPVAGWTSVEGRTVVSGGCAIWHLPSGPFTYAELSFLPGTLRYNVPPGG